MKELIQKNWWSLALRGLLLVIFGVLVLAGIADDVESLMGYLGAMFLVTGLIYLVSGAVFYRRLKNWVTLICISTIDIFIGLYVLFNASSSQAIFTYIIGGWGILIGIFISLLAFSYRKYRVVILINGIISAILGVVIIANPLEPSAMNLLVGLYTVLLGAVIIYQGFRLKSSFSRQPPATPPQDNSERTPEPPHDEDGSVTG